MSKRHICVREEYTNASGEKKGSFQRIGEVFTGKNGKEYAKLYHIPGTLLYLFEEKKSDRSMGGDIQLEENPF